MLQIQNGQKIGPYQIEEFLGRGAFAQVHAASDSKGRRYALKVGDDSGGGRYLPRFGEVTVERDPRAVSPDETPAEALFLDPHDGARPEVLDSAEVDDLLLHEAELLERGAAGAIARLHGVVEADGRPVLVMDLVEGRTLRERIRSMEGIRLSWMLELCGALEHLHAEGWHCHGDVKPENVLIDRDERLVLVDPVPEASREDRIVTTPWYNPFLRWDAKGDAQAVAIMLYELMVGALPFDQVPWPLAGTRADARGEDERELSRSLYLSYPPMRELNSLVPRQIERIFHRAMCDEAYGLAQLRRELEAFLLRR